MKPISKNAALGLLVGHRQRQHELTRAKSIPLWQAEIERIKANRNTVGSDTARRFTAFIETAETEIFKLESDAEIMNWIASQQQ